LAPHCDFSADHGTGLSYVAQSSLPKYDNFAHPYSTGYGFPTTFGLVIASIIGVIAIQLLVLRDRKRGKFGAGSLEETP
jgi:hypothetical protein